MEAGGVRILSDLLTLAHLHINRAVMPTQTNVIEASPDMARDSEKEWYYQVRQHVIGMKYSISFYWYEVFYLPSNWADILLIMEWDCWWDFNVMFCDHLR